MNNIILTHWCRRPGTSNSQVWQSHGLPTNVVITKVVADRKKPTENWKNYLLILCNLFLISMCTWIKSALIWLGTTERHIRFMATLFETLYQILSSAQIPCSLSLLFPIMTSLCLATNRFHWKEFSLSTVTIVIIDVIYVSQTLYATYSALLTVTATSRVVGLVERRWQIYRKVYIGDPTT